MRDFGYWRYSLRSAAPLNAVTGRRTYDGALVRSETGFGCLHPWPELGDPSLEDCLADLAGPQRFRLVRRTLACLKADGKAREDGRSLFEGLAVPPSHATLTVCDERSVERAVESGFELIKVKVGRMPEKELEKVRGLGHRWPGLRWRLDFNESGRAGELIDLFSKWSDTELQRVDFLEDPVLYESGDWSKLAGALGIPLANDRNMSRDRGDSPVLIVKPAVDEMPPPGPRVVVTSYLDHPLGQCFAAWEAAKAGVTETCGLQTHGAFEPDAFSELMGGVSPCFRVPEGAGLGFGDLLESLPWLQK